MVSLGMQAEMVLRDSGAIALISLVSNINLGAKVLKVAGEWLVSAAYPLNIGVNVRPAPQPGLK